MQKVWLDLDEQKRTSSHNLPKMPQPILEYTEKREIMKKCTECKEVKPVEEFYKDKHLKNGLKSWCKSCDAEATRQWQINNPEKVNSKDSKRRALKLNSTVEKVDLLQLYNTHNWICGICDLKIDKRLKYPSPMRISHDHIIPLSKGGSHTYDNIQPAHLGCNISKGNRIKNLQLKLQTI